MRQRVLVAALAAVLAEPRMGAAALEPELDRIAAIKTKAELAGALAHLHNAGTSGLFGFGAQPDFKNAKIHIAAVDQGGLALPDRDYYLKDEERFANVRKQYPAHVEKMLELLGDAPDVAAREAQAARGIGTGLPSPRPKPVNGRVPATSTPRR